MNISDYQTKRFPTWCPGCGNFGIWAALKNALLKMNWSPDNFVLVYGIGCSGNMADFIKCYGFHSLHGRSVPVAVGIKTANHKLPVVVVTGDGDCYGEGGNHLIHAARGNHDITVIVHDNRVYGLTTGQVSPTAAKGYKSKSTPQGALEVGVNPLSLAITEGATFVAQGFAGDIPSLSEIISQGLSHRGFSLINILQPCVTFNKINTYMYYREHTYKLDQNYNSNDKIDALRKVMDADKIPLGVLYKEERPTYQQSLPQLSATTLFERKPSNFILDDLYKEFL